MTEAEEVEGLVQEGSGDAALMEKSSNQWCPDFAIEVQRQGSVWLAFAPALRGNLATGHSLSEVLVRWHTQLRELYTFMHAKVLSDKEPTPQYLAYRKLIGEVDRSDDSESDPVSLNQSSPSSFRGLPMKEKLESTAGPYSVQRISKNGTVLAVEIVPVYAGCVPGPAIATILGPEREKIAALIVKCCNGYQKAVESLEKVLIGGNHLGLVIGADHPPWTATYEEARAHYGPGDGYEVWCCWKTIMEARAVLSELGEGKPSAALSDAGDAS